MAGENVTEDVHKGRPSKLPRASDDLSRTVCVQDPKEHIEMTVRESLRNQRCVTWCLGSVVGVTFVHANDIYIYI